MMNIDTSSSSTILASLNKIAESLILVKRILINHSEYAIIDLEIYYHHQLYHTDTYAIKHEKGIGEFELHKYGIDISLGNSTQVYGGILIRGLYDFQTNLVFNKSQVVRTLFNNLNFGDNKVELISKNNPWSKVFKSKRINLGAPRNDLLKQNFCDELYKFMPADKSILKNYPDKERILRDSNLSVSEKGELLGYYLKDFVES